MLGRVTNIDRKLSALLFLAVFSAIFIVKADHTHDFGYSVAKSGISSSIVNHSAGECSICDFNISEFEVYANNFNLSILYQYSEHKAGCKAERLSSLASLNRHGRSPPVTA